MLDWLSTSTLYREIIKKRSPYMTGVLLLHENENSLCLDISDLYYVPGGASRPLLYIFCAVPCRKRLSEALAELDAELFDLCSVFRSVHFIHLIFLP